MPLRLLLRDLLHLQATMDAGELALHQIAAFARTRVLVLLLDQQPVLLALLAAGVRTQPHQSEAAIQALAVNDKLQLAFPKALVRVFNRLPGALIPEHHGAAAVLAFGNRAFECAVFDRMILGAYGKPLVAGIHAGAARDRPALQNAFVLEAEVEVQVARLMPLNEIGVAIARIFACAWGFARSREIALRTIVF